MKPFKGPKHQRGFFGALGGILSGVSGLIGGGVEHAGLKATQKDLQNLPGMKGPANVSGNFGTSADGNFQMDQGMLNMQNAMGAGGQYMLGGGMYNDPRLQAALAGNDIAGALGQANTAFGAQMGGSAYGGLPGMFNQSQALSGGLAQNIAQGPMDLTGGLQSGFFGMGMDNLANAADQQGLYNQQLNTMRAAAAPEFQRQSNAMMDKLHGMGMLSSTGGAAQMQGLLEAQNAADLGFQNAAFDRGFQQQGLLSNLGMQQAGMGSTLMGQNLGQYNANLGNYMGLQNLGLGVEGQGFGQGLQANQFNTSQGMNRLQSAMGLFGQGADLRNQSFGLGLQGGAGMLDYGNFGLQASAMPYQLQASLMEGSSGHAAARSGIGTQVAESGGGLFGGLASGIGGALSGIFS